MKILYKFCSRSRPEKFFNTLDNIYINSRNKNFNILATLDYDDITMNNDNVMNRISNYENVIPIFGHSKTKIEAYNRDLNKGFRFDILINMSDDMVFTQEGFDEIIISDMKDHFPDMDGLLHYNDGNQKSNVITLGIMGREYFKRFGYIYHPSYKSLWCDNEQMEVAKILGKYRYMGDGKVLFKHYHPAWGLGAMDALYVRNEDRGLWIDDEENFNKRKANNFFLSV